MNFNIKTKRREIGNNKKTKFEDEENNIQREQKQFVQNYKKFLDNLGQN